MKKILNYSMFLFILGALILCISKPEDMLDKALGAVLITLYLVGLREIKYLSSKTMESATLYICISSTAFAAAAVALWSTGDTSYIAMCILLGIIFFSALFVHMRYSLMATLSAGSLAFFFNFLTIEMFLKDLLVGLIVTLIAAGFKFFTTTDWSIPKEDKPRTY